MFLEHAGFIFRIIPRNRTRGSVGSRVLLSAVLLAASTVGVAQSQKTTGANAPHSGINDPALDQRVESLLQKMTLEEKVGQLVQYSAGQPTGPGTGRTDYEDMIAHGQISSLFNVVDPHQINAYQHIAVDKSRLHIPILFGLDVI